MGKSTQNSQEFPLYSSNRSPKICNDWKYGKQSLPECTFGVSKEFPSYFENNG